MSDLIIETTDETFELDVIERSKMEPVVVDFWAEWCQPCRMLTPMLEKLADEFASRVTLVKANTEQCQQAAGQFGVAGIPALFGVAGGEVVDGIQGVVAEDVLRSFFARMVTISALAEAKQIEESEPERAIEIYRKICDEFSDAIEAKIGLGRTALIVGDRDTAANILDELESRGFLEPEAEQLKSRFALSVDESGESLDDLTAAVDADPANLELAVTLARKLASAGQHEAALDHALKVIESQRSGPGEEARVLMIDIFRSLPDDSPLTRNYRRKLTMVLY